MVLLLPPSQDEVQRLQTNKLMFYMGSKDQTWVVGLACQILSPTGRSLCLPSYSETGFHGSHLAMNSLCSQDDLELLTLLPLPPVLELGDRITMLSFFLFF